MKLRTLHTVVFGGVSHAPGSLIEIGDEEARRLIALHAAEVPLDEATEVPKDGTLRRRKREQ
jgi:hypothetical protein